MDTSKMIKAYCLKTKEKNVPMHDAVVTKTAKGGYMAGGHDGKGNKMAAIMSEANALKAIADALLKKSLKGFISLQIATLLATKSGSETSRSLIL